MNLTYKALKSQIERGAYKTAEEKEVIIQKMDIFLIGDRMTQEQFNATVLGTTAQGVAWSVEPTGNGTITPSGLFTADEAATGETTIVATSTKTNTVSGTARIGSIS